MTFPAGAVIVELTGAGARGPKGSQFLDGNGVPSSGLGNNGDFYFDTNGRQIYGPKAAGAWGAGTSLVGATGATGDVTPAATAAAVAAALAAATAGVYAISAAANVPRGAIAGALTPGSGGSNGTNIAATFSGGNYIGNPTILFDIVSGAVTNVRIISPGLYIGASPTAPTVTLPGGAGGAALTLTNGFLIGNGQGYWVQSADTLTLDRYKNVGGVATADTTAVQSIPTTPYIDAALAAVLAIGTIKADLTSAIEESPTSLLAAQARSLESDRMLEPVTFIDKILGTNGAGFGARPFRPLASFDYAWAPLQPTTTSQTLLLRNGQRQVVTSPILANIPTTFGGGSGSGIFRRNIAGYGGDGNYGACLDARLSLAGATWTASGGGYSATVTLPTVLAFTNHIDVSGVHLLLWLVTDDYSDPLGLYGELKMGGANPAANNTTVDGTSGVLAWTMSYSGQTSGDVRGETYTGATYTFHVKMPDGSNPTGQQLMFAIPSGFSFIGGSHGHILTFGTTSKDTVSFYPTGNVNNGLMPWFESFTTLGAGGHGAVGPNCTVGAFKATGYPQPGEPTASQGYTGGYGLNVFDQGFDFTTQYLHHGSIEISGFQGAIFGHGGSGNVYRGWIIPGDITISNVQECIDLQLTFIEGFKHYGRFIADNVQTLITSYLNQDFKIAGRGGRFVCSNTQSRLFNANASGTVVNNVFELGSDDPTETFEIDASAVAGLNHATIFAYSDASGPLTQFASITLKHVVDVTVINAGTATYKFSLPQAGFFNPYADFTLIGSKLGDAWPTSDFQDWPHSIYVDGNSEWGFHGRTWSQIETAMAALGNACTIMPGAKAVDGAGVVVDVK